MKNFFINILAISFITFGLSSPADAVMVTKEEALTVAKKIGSTLQYHINYGWGDDNTAWYALDEIYGG